MCGFVVRVPMLKAMPTLRASPAKRTRGFVAATALACSVLWGCGGDEPYRIAAVLDNDGVRGAARAVADINAGGGINGHPLSLTLVSNAASTRASDALEVAQRVSDDAGILAVVGHTNSGASLAASQVYNARHLVQIAPTSTSPLFGRSNQYAFRLVASDVHQGAFLAHQALMRSPRPRVAIAYVNDDYGRPLRDLVLRGLREGGLEPVYNSPFVEDDSVAAAEMVMSMKEMRPGLLLWIGRANDFANIQPALKLALPALTVIASDGFGGPMLTSSAARFAGVTYVRLVDAPRAESLLAARTVGRGARVLDEVSDQAILSYDAVCLIAEAIRQTGPHRERIRDWLSRVGRDLPAYNGVSGPISFTPEGDRTPQYFLRPAAPEQAP